MLLIAMATALGCITAVVVFPRRRAYHSTMVNKEDPEQLRIRLAELAIEHRDLDAAIARFDAVPPADQLLLRRLKKRKLLLKDRVALIERMLEPDALA